MPDTEPLDAERLAAIRRRVKAVRDISAGQTLTRRVAALGASANDVPPLLTEVARLTAALAASEKIARDNGFALARQAPTVARARNWQQRAEEAEAEVLERGQANRELSKLYAEACRKLDAANAELGKVSQLAGGMLKLIPSAEPATDEMVRALSPTVQAEPSRGLLDAFPELADVRFTFDPRRNTSPHTHRGPRASDPDCEHPAHDGQTCEEYERPAAAPVVAEATQTDDDWPEVDEDYSPPCGNDECRQMHCGRCNEHSGSMGHYASVCRRLGGLNGPTVPHHQCCPGNCELAAPDAVPAAAADAERDAAVSRLVDHLKGTGASATLVAQSGQLDVEGLLAAGWTWDGNVEYVEGKRIRTLVAPPGTLTVPDPPAAAADGPVA